MSLSKLIVLALAWFSVAAMSPGVWAADEPTDIEVLFPFPAEKPRGGGVASIGEAKMELVLAGGQTGGRPLIILSGTKAPVQGAWWFPKHLPMTSEQAHVGDSQARLVFHVQAARAVKSDFMVRWRVDGEEGQWVTTGVIELTPDRLLLVEMPIPELKPGARITGMILSFSEPGEYQIRKIAIARAAQK